MPPTTAAPLLCPPQTPGLTGAELVTSQLGMRGNSAFLGFLSQLSLNVKHTDNENILPQFGNAGFNLDPAMLVLPPGISNLSGSDLRAYLAAQAEKSGLSDTILAGLTSGTPQMPSYFDALNADFIITPDVNDAELGTDLAPFSTTFFHFEDTIPNDGDCALDEDMESIRVAAHMNLLGEIACELPYTTIPTMDSEVDTSEISNPLLIVTGLSPAQIESFEQQLAAGADARRKESDSNDAALALINFLVPTPNEEPTNNAGDLGIKKHFGRPLHPYEIQKLAQNMDQGDLGDDAGYVATFASSLGHTNGKVHASLAAPTQSDSTTSSLNPISQFFISAGSTSSSEGLLIAQGMQNSLTYTNQASSPLLYNNNAGSSHPATQIVAATLTKAAGQPDKEKTLSVELDPPELGRVQVHLSYEKGESLRIHVVTEKQETLTLLQRDAHALKSALDDAGIKADSSSLSFDMAGSDQSFNQMLGQFHDNQRDNESKRFNVSDSGKGSIDNTSTIMIETHLNDVPSFGANGQGYSFLA